MSQILNFKFDNHINMVNEFKIFLLMESLTDVTLGCDGQSLKAHKIILSAFSPYLKSLFLENPCKHPIVIFKDIKYTELKPVIDFMYSGEINLADDQILAVIKTAQTLKVKGLGELEFQNNDDEAESALRDELECQSEGESSEQSIYGINDSNLALQNSHLSQIQSVSGESDDGIYEPEIKQEVCSSDCSVPDSPTPLQSHNTHPVSESLLEESFKQNYDDISQKHFQSPSANIPGLVFPRNKLSEEPCHLPIQSVKELEQNSSDDSSFSSVPFASKPSSDACVCDHEKPGSSSAPPCKMIQKKPTLKTVLSNFVKRPRKKPAIKNNKTSNSKQAQVKSKNTGTTKYKLKCGVCAFETTNLQDLKNHMTAAGHEGDVQFQCDQCKYYTNIRKNLERHITTVHEKIKPYLCIHCPKKFSQHYLLRNHFIRVHKNAQESKKTFMCKKCDFSAPDKASIKEHMTEVHALKKDVICPLCNYRAATKKGVVRHMKEEHEEEN